MRSRDDSEHEQILIRIGIGSLAFAYVLLGMEVGDLAWNSMWIVSGHLLGGLGLLVYLLFHPGSNPPRRYFGMILDMTALTLILLSGQSTTALFYPFYLWVTLGMGFRYGRTYMFVSAVLSALSFALVIIFSPSWQDHLALTSSLWVALLILPAYASSLLVKLTTALHHAEDANRTKGRFLATMSHELRTPLHAIIGMADLLGASRLDGEQRHMIGTVRGAGQALLEMIEDILDVASAESGRIINENDDFDLHVTLGTVRRLLQHQAIAKGIDLDLAVDPDLPFKVRGVARWVKQILINLIGNAIKFTESGRITIRVAADQVDAEQVFLRIDVEDTGIGIVPDALDRIFQQFTQADDSTTRRYGGTGLGLAIARQLAEKMGGSLSVRSEEGVGSCFTFQALLARAQEGESRSLAGQVVVVGDADMAYDRLLRSWGVEPFAAKDGAAAARLLESETATRTVLLINPVVERLHRSLGLHLSSHLTSEPIDLICIGGEQLPEDWARLAALTVDHSEEQLFNIMHAALATSASMGDERRFDLRRPGIDSRRILVAEDNRINQKVIEKMLSVGGHAVTLVGNGEELLDKLDQNEFDLVLVDLNMPTMNGLDALKLHRFAVGADHIPFVALTADATDESRRKCHEAGMAGYLTKPVDIDELLRLIERLTLVKKTSVEGESTGAAVLHHPRFAQQRPVLDYAYISRLRELDQGDGFFRGVIQDFIDDAAMLILELEAAVVSGDGIVFRDRAHALRSSAAHLGATGIYDLCHGWRDFGPDELAEKGGQEMSRLRSEFERLRTALQSLISGPPGYQRSVDIEQWSN